MSLSYWQLFWTLQESLTSSKIIATLNHFGVLWLYNNDYYSLPLVISLEKVQFKYYFSQVRSFLVYEHVKVTFNVFPNLDTQLSYRNSYYW